MHFQPIERTDEQEYQPQGGAGMEPEIVNDALDDVWGADDDQDPGHQDASQDMRRLESEHATAGYREGIAVGKQETLQEGFDEGYSMGAAIGLQAGQILGILEGISEAVRTKSQPGDDGKGDNAASVQAAEKLLADARAELSVERLFSSEYWSSAVQPTYDVAPAVKYQKDGALSHPLICKWTGVLEQQLQLWAINRSVMGQQEAGIEAPAPSAAPQDQKLEHGAQPPTVDSLDW